MIRSQSVKRLAKNYALYLSLAVAVIVAIPVLAVLAYGVRLLVPFLLELKGVIKGWSGRYPSVIAVMLVLMGGYMLRHYFMYAGVYSYPW